MAPDRTVFRAHLPATLDLAAVTRPAWAAYAAWVVSAVVVRRFIDRSADETAFVPLGSEYVDRHLPAKVRRPLLADLVQARVLECDNLYYFGRYAGGGPGKCLCYRVGPTYRGAGIRPVLVTHTELLRKMRVAYQDERDELTDPVHLALRRWHDRVEVLPTAPAGEHPLLDAMLDGERRFSVCPMGRVHHNVANLPAQYRRHLRLAGHELASVDVSASQPLLLALQLTGRAVPDGREVGDGTQAVFHPSSNPSLSVFLRDCRDGSVYDRVAGEAGRYTRDEVKALFLAVVYGDPRDMHTVVGEAVRRLYPAAFDAVVRLAYDADGNNPRPIGTGTLFEVGDRKFIVSAGHVIEKVDAFSGMACAFVPGDPGEHGIRCTLVPITGHGHRFPDPADVAVFALTEECAGAMPRGRFLRLTESAVQPEMMGCGWLCGFPNEYIRALAPGAKRLEPLTLGTVIRPHDGSGLLDYDPEVHFALDANRSAFGLVDGGGSAPLPDRFEGISGCAVWQTWWPSRGRPDERRARGARVVGVQTGYYRSQSLIKVTRWGVVAELLRMTFPDLRPILGMHFGPGYGQ